MVRVIDHLSQLYDHDKPPGRPGMGASTDRNKHSIKFLVDDPLHPLPVKTEQLAPTTVPQLKQEDIISCSTRSDIAMSPVDDLLYAANLIAHNAPPPRQSPSVTRTVPIAPSGVRPDNWSFSSNGSSRFSDASCTARVSGGNSATGASGGVQKRRKKRANVACDICNKTFGEAAAVRKHKRVVHEKVKDFKCDICGRRFAEKSNLKKHVQARHEQSRSHKCEECGKVFNFTDGLRRHFNNCHLGLRPYQCDICSSSFKQRTHLQKHRQSVHRVPTAARKDVGRPVASMQ